MRSGTLLAIGAALLAIGLGSCGGNAATAPTQSLYDKYGGAPTVAKIVDELTVVVVSDCVTAPYFTDILARPGGPERLKSCLRLQFTALLGGPAAYPGQADLGQACRDMPSSHAGLGITPTVFDKFVLDIVGVLRINGFGEKDIDSVAPALVALKPQIVSANPRVFNACPQF